MTSAALLFPPLAKFLALNPNGLHPLPAGGGKIARYPEIGCHPPLPNLHHKDVNAMRVSERKLEANRANAQNSTGPQTKQGKAASAQNARSHGLSARHLFIPENRAEDFQAMLNAYFEEIRPAGEIQLALFEQLVHAAWNLGIARELHAGALETLVESRITLAMRYIAQWERSFERALKALKAEQTDLALRAARENEPITGLPITCQIRIIANEATKIARRDPAHRRAVLAAIGEAFRPAPEPPLPGEIPAPEPAAA
jgi:hypothetical protein